MDLGPRDSDNMHGKWEVEYRRVPYVLFSFVRCGALRMEMPHIYGD